jgi:tetratricopeptide (TPR) repeat protein
MLETFKRINNPLTIIAIFSGITEIGGTVVLPFLSEQNQGVYLWFLIAFPCLLVTFFFLTLNFNNKVLYAPSDFEDENNFVGLMGIKFEQLESRLEKAVTKELSETVSNIESNISSQEHFNRAKTYFTGGQYEEALDEINQAFEIKESGVGFNLKAMIYSRNMKYRQAIEMCSKGLELNNSATTTASLYWNRACYKSLLQQSPKSAIDDLREAVLHNIELAEKLDSDEDLEYVRSIPEYKEFASEILS